MPTASTTPPTSRASSQAARAAPDAVINGRPVYDASVPKGRLYGRYAHPRLGVDQHAVARDPRLDVRLPRLPARAGARADRRGVASAGAWTSTPRSLVRLHWRGVGIENLATRGDATRSDGVSHFDVWRDNVRISAHAHAAVLRHAAAAAAPGLAGAAMTQASGAALGADRRATSVGGIALPVRDRPLARAARRSACACTRWCWCTGCSTAPRAGPRSNTCRACRPGTRVRRTARTAPEPAPLRELRRNAARQAAGHRRPLSVGQGAHAGARSMLRQIASGQGGVIVTAHIGCLELCQALADDAPGFRLTVLVHTAHAERLQPPAAAPQSGLPASSCCRSPSSTPATAMQLASASRRGEFVAIAGDRVPVQQRAQRPRRIPRAARRVPDRPVRAGFGCSAARCSLMACTARRRRLPRSASSSSPSVWCCPAMLASRAVGTGRAVRPAGWRAGSRTLLSTGSILSRSGTRIHHDASPR